MDPPLLPAEPSSYFAVQKNRLARMSSNQPGVAVLNRTTAGNDKDTDGDNDGARHTNSTADNMTGSN